MKSAFSPPLPPAGLPPAPACTCSDTDHWFLFPFRSFVSVDVDLSLRYAPPICNIDSRRAAPVPLCPPDLCGSERVWSMHCFPLFNCPLGHGKRRGKPADPQIADIGWEALLPRSRTLCKFEIMWRLHSRMPRLGSGVSRWETAIVFVFVHRSAGRLRSVL